MWKTARPQLDTGIFDQPEKLIEYPIARLEKLQVALAAPVIAQREVIAVLLVGYRREHVFTVGEKEHLEKAATELELLLREATDD